MPAYAVPPVVQQDMTLQCAWCRRVKDTTGLYSGDAQPLLRTATHGICPPCAAGFLSRCEAELARRAPAVGLALT